jgi:drug/metabolite transporter (DMT)-like permease
LLCGAAVTFPAAVRLEARPDLGGGAALLALAGAAAFAAQYLLLFRLQRLAVPVYLSQIGAVAAVVGATLAVQIQGEQLPERFGIAAALVVAGLVAFQSAQVRRWAG